MTFYEPLWRAPNNAKLPDFILGGAMKCGTSTIHAILNQHPDVFIPNKELHFYDMDNIVQHPDFNFWNRGCWFNHNLINSPEMYWQWYSSQFECGTNAQAIGEDSTTYLASESAIKRIAMQDKKIKLLIMLRHPTARTYSHYWHMVKAGKAMYSFEDTLQYTPYNLLDRSSYFKQLKIVFSYLSKEQVKVVLFEDFLSNKEGVLKGVCDFLNIHYDKLPSNALSLHENKAQTPRFLSLHLLKSKFFRGSSNRKYINHFDGEFSKKLPESKCASIFEYAYNVVNPLVSVKPDKICPATKQFLDQYFYQELQGIDELLEQEVISKWFK